MAASGSKTYTTLVGNEMFGETLQCDSGFTFVDFVPKQVDSKEHWTIQYEKFRCLVERANAFLRSNPKWKIVTCETFEFKIGLDKDQSKMTYTEFGRYLRGLRLWLVEKEEKGERDQQIGYLYLVPQQLKKAGFFDDAVFESLDTVVQRFNSMQRFNPITGRIITIESLKMKTKDWREFDPDKSTWSTEAKQLIHFAVVIKIFYEVGNSNPEEIGIRDFIPSKITEGGVFSLPKYERFTNVLDKASIWWSQQQDLRFCNAKSLRLKGKKVEAQKMSYVENDDDIFAYYIQILRIAYTKPIYPASEKHSPMTKITSRTFTPIQLNAGVFSSDYESVWITRERIAAWVKATGVHVVSVETTSYPKRPLRSKNEGPEATFLKTGGQQDDTPWLIAIRLYINGIFTEPPSQMLPPMPVIEESSCHIS